MTLNETQTEFNASVASLFRLHELLIDCNTLRRQTFTDGYNINSLRMWKLTIDAIHAELYPKLQGTPKHEYINKLVNQYNKMASIMETKITESGRVLQLNLKNFMTMYKLIDKIEKELRTFADKKGMLITEKTDEWGDLDEL